MGVDPVDGGTLTGVAEIGHTPGTGGDADVLVGSAQTVVSALAPHLADYLHRGQPSLDRDDYSYLGAPA